MISHCGVPFLLLLGMHGDEDCHGHCDVYVSALIPAMAPAVLFTFVFVPLVANINTVEKEYNSFPYYENSFLLNSPSRFLRPHFENQDLRSYCERG
jgi:hypothetical protein